MISFIVPAYNEEAWLGTCLSSIRTSMDEVAERYEVIVVDDASTDATLRIAQEAGVRTLRVQHRKISAVRNAGARTACGAAFFFVDADTLINPDIVGRPSPAFATEQLAGVACPGLKGVCHYGGRRYIPSLHAVCGFFASQAARVFFAPVLRSRQSEDSVRLTTPLRMPFLPMP
jgi:glycosyltransferase involved in cell wall biosynthesis